MRYVQQQLLNRRGKKCPSAVPRATTSATGEAYSSVPQRDGSKRQCMYGIAEQETENVLPARAFENSSRTAVS